MNYFPDTDWAKLSQSDHVVWYVVSIVLTELKIYASVHILVTQL